LGDGGKWGKVAGAAASLAMIGMAHEMGTQIGEAIAPWLFDSAVKENRNAVQDAVEQDEVTSSLIDVGEHKAKKGTLTDDNVAYLIQQRDQMTQRLKTAKSRDNLPDWWNSFDDIVREMVGVQTSKETGRMSTDQTNQATLASEIGRLNSLLDSIKNGAIKVQMDNPYMAGNNALEGTQPAYVPGPDFYG
jgi:hypothetical protein